MLSMISLTSPAYRVPAVAGSVYFPLNGSGQEAYTDRGGREREGRGR
jgi:hypothetical protein